MSMKYLTTKEQEMLFEQIYKEKGRHRKRNIALFEIAKYCALRASEITHLQLSDYNRYNKTIHCKRLKGSNSNTLKIVDAHVLKALDDYIDERSCLSIESSYLFISQKGTPISRQRMDAMIKHYCRLTNYIPPEKSHMHVLRHTRAIELTELEFDIDDVQYWLGHKNSENTFKYLEYTSVLRKALFNRLAQLEQHSYENRY